MPLNGAIYLSSTDKIYGVMENYIVKFNATTGQREAYARICAPCYGPMQICTGGSSIYVASMHDYSINVDYFGADPGYAANKEIWIVDPNTLAASNALGWGQTIMSLSWWDLGWYAVSGPTNMVISGGYVYFIDRTTGDMWYSYINLGNPADNNRDNGVSYTNQTCVPEAIAIHGTDEYFPDSRHRQIDWSLITYPNWTAQPSFSSTPDYCMAVVYVGGYLYAVGGNETMHKWDAGTAAHTTFNLGAVWADVKPFRLRISPLTGNLYIPCQDQDAIIIWDPVSDTGTGLGGFASPVDVVFTNSKSWAVQSGPVGLKEII